MLQRDGMAFGVEMKGWRLGRWIVVCVNESQELIYQRSYVR
jgi:hypothetical protein